MNWFKRLFGINGNEKAENSEFNPEIEVAEDLFIDEQPPKPETAINQKVSGISDFLELDFRSKGYDDGYEFHSSEKMNQGFQNIRSEFRLEVDKVIDQKQKEILELKDQRIESKGISEELVEKIDSKLEHLDAVLQKLEQEKVLSVDNEGWIGKAIYRYRNGYVRGMDMYYQEKQIGGSTGFFN